MHMIVDWFTEISLWLSFGLRPLAVILVSAMPLIELKGGIPVGVKLGLSPMESFCWAFLGSSIVCIPLLLLLKPFFAWAKKRKGVGAFFTKIENMFLAKAKKDEDAEKVAERKKIWVTFLFAALPLPGAGVWSSSFVAVLLGLRFWPAVLAIVGANFLEGLFIWFLTSLIGEKNVNIMILVLFAVVVLYLVYFIYKVVRSEKRK
jgi:uncharacterized membrane protein